MFLLNFWIPIYLQLFGHIDCIFALMHIIYELQIKTLAVVNIYHLS